MSAEPQKTESEPEGEQAAWDREQEEAERKVLDERVGMLVADRYRIVRTLGAGGMGGVYEAEHELIGKRVALKCLHREYSRDRDLVERFKREARAATAIGNEHIVDVTDMGDMTDGAPFIVMEVLQGQTLNNLIEEGGPMRIPRAVHIARQVCDALGAAHAKGIVHRDLKPENIFLVKRGGDVDFVKVLDFGISKMHGGDRKDRGLTRTGMAIGTPSYMSPEQAQGLRDVDHRTDIWALGVIIYEMLTSRRPFDADSYPMLLMKIVGAEPERLLKWRKDVPDPLDGMIMRCLEKPVGTRMQSMGELEVALTQFQAQFQDGDRTPDLTSEEARGDKNPASRTVARGKRASQPEGDATDEPIAKGTAATQVVGSTPPPSKEASGVRSSAQQPAGGTAVGGSFDARKASTGKDRGQPLALDDSPAAESKRPAEAKNARAAPAQTGEMGAIARKGQPRTQEIGAISRERREDDDPSEIVPPKSNTPMIAIGAFVVLAVVAGVAWAAGGGGGASTAPIVTPPIVTPPVALAPEPPPVPHTDPVPAAPLEVRVRIQVMPIEARITINDVEFPNPMDSLQTRSLTPTRIRAERDGYRTLEQLVVFDSDQNFHFALARGGGVQHVGLTGAEEHVGSGTPPPPGTETPPAHEEPHEHGVTPPTGTGDGFRDQF